MVTSEIIQSRVKCTERPQEPFICHRSACALLLTVCSFPVSRGLPCDGRDCYHGWYFSDSPWGQASLSSRSCRLLFVLSLFCSILCFFPLSTSRNPSPRLGTVLLYVLQAHLPSPLSPLTFILWLCRKFGSLVIFFFIENINIWNLFVHID